MKAETLSDEQRFYGVNVARTFLKAKDNEEYLTLIEIYYLSQILQSDWLPYSLSIRREIASAG